ncbi:hypothetical protein Dalk_4772 [Desulfatibacillum aliphaticivorans]|uniref:Uncharacterized protein n=1 Tax=Desulfatibacillum aliphaticivorans TaxID=218208 RepID=B8FD19_DESAL|nr:hypothetical protein [Desulfatibacillum aliphaticivorans]ACL06450.1 hypothetical protein Dalk_4772 [Desulfatibacillum aliphaticivorans]
MKETTEFREQGHFRNYLCPRYDSCLNALAARDIEVTPCHFCPYSNDHSGQVGSLDDLPGVYDLLTAIFAPLYWMEHCAEN